VEPEVVPVVVTPQVGSGPTTEEPPSEAPAPGPTPDPSVSSDASGTAFDGGSFAAQAAGAFHAPEDRRRLAGDTATGTVDLGNGIGFEVPDGFEIQVSQPGYGQVFGEGGYFIAYLTAAPTDLQTIVVNHLQGLQDLGIQDLQISEPEDVQIPTSSVVSAATLNFVGVLASQQGGSIPVQGFAYYFLLQDGTGVTAFGLFQQGEIDSEDDPLVVAYNSMLNSLVGTF
jgi:hypothetical protein